MITCFLWFSNFSRHSAAPRIESILGSSYETYSFGFKQTRQVQLLPCLQQRLDSCSSASERNVSKVDSMDGPSARYSLVLVFVFVLTHLQMKEFNRSAMRLNEISQFYLDRSVVKEAKGTTWTPEYFCEKYSIHALRVTPSMRSVCVKRRLVWGVALESRQRDSNLVENDNHFAG